mmetsp:Transcript_56935/g.161649  ORF Transcript_56935/g.161649 Transcript_56935/m.161649 type:complete len:329 (-) Transcript_56935:79-1065(-)
MTTRAKLAPVRDLAWKPEHSEPESSGSEGSRSPKVLLEQPGAGGPGYPVTSRATSTVTYQGQCEGMSTVPKMRRWATWKQARFADPQVEQGPLDVATPQHRFAFEPRPRAPAAAPARRGPAGVFDVVHGPGGEPAILPVGKPGFPAKTAKDLPEDSVVTVRVFRFFWDTSDASDPWERQLLNVNSGSILWLIVHMLPKMHTASGCKFGKWFTVHTLRVSAKHFGSNYCICREGCCAAKTFGCTEAHVGLITGEELESGYFWFVTPAEQSPVEQEAHLEERGWQHVARAGPFDGDELVEQWQRQGSPMGEAALQEVLGAFLEGQACSRA